MAPHSFVFPLLTLADEVRLGGLGLHSGAPVEVVIRPGNQGIGFWHGAVRIAASPDHVTDATRCTRLGEVGVVEHLMAAFAGVGVTDAEVEVTAPELPAMDGSATPFLGALQSIGTQQIGEATLEGPFARVYAKEGAAEVAVATGDGWWRYVFALETGDQDFEMQWTTEAFATQVAPARTIAFEAEIPVARKLGLGLGLDETSVIVVGRGGYLNEARFADEPARHKLLDLVGDLYLSGVPPQFLNVVGEQSGHRLAIQAAVRLATAVRIERRLA